MWLPLWSGTNNRRKKVLSLEKIDFLSASAFLFLFGIGLITYIIITSIFLFKTEMAIPILNWQMLFSKNGCKNIFHHTCSSIDSPLPQEVSYLLFMNLNKFLRFVLAQSLNCVQLFVTPWTLSLQAPLSSTISQSLLKFISTEMMMLPKHLILCHPPTLLPSIFPNIKVFFNEIALHIRCPKYQSFSFSNNPYNEYLGLISFRIVRFDLLAVQDTLKSVFLGLLKF